MRTYARAEDAMIAAATRVINQASGARVVVAHANAPAVAASVAERVRARATQPVHSFDVVEAGPVIATHAGPDAIGVVVLPG